MIEFGLTEAQTIAQRSFRSVLREVSPLSKVREWEQSHDGFDRAVYQRLADLGWLGLLLPESFGGQGSDWVGATLLYEELGRSLLPGPHYAAMVCAEVLARYAPAALRARLLPTIVGGDRTMAPAFWERNAKTKLSQVSSTATPTENGYRIEGEKQAVEFGHLVDQLLVAVVLPRGDTSCGLAVVDSEQPGVEAERIESLGGEPRALVRLSGVEVARENVFALSQGEAQELERLQVNLRLLRAAELVGAAEQALELAVGYAKARVQYGRPIGAFQAIQHKLANCALRIELAKWPVYYAAWQLSEAMPADEAVASAVLKSGEMGRFVTAEAVQAHGGLGVIEGSDVSLYFRRAKARQIELGYPDQLQERIAVALGL